MSSSEVDGVAPIREAVTVRCGPERAFHVFTDQFGAWWPVESYSRVVSELKDENVKTSGLEFQTRQGGSILEYISDGRILPWGEVIDWSPPHRILLSWHPHSMPEPSTEVEVKFVAADGGTEVQVEHREWEVLSEAFRNALYDVYVEGWPLTLRLFAAAADRAAS